MRIGIAAVQLGPTTMVDALVAGAWLKAEWVGSPPPVADQVIDVELDIDSVLRWTDTIATEGTETALRPGPLLRGTVEQQNENVLTVRIAEGLLQVEVDDGSIDVPVGTAIAVVAEHLKLYPTGT